MAFTKQIPEWNATGVEPPQSLKDNGWKAGVKPAADYFNWFQNKASAVLQELQQKAGEVKTVNGQLPDSKGNVNVNIDTSKLATKEELNSASTYIQQEMNDLEQTVVAHKADLVSHGIYGTATGTNTLVMTCSNVSAYVEGMLVAFKNTTANTGAVTLNINSLGAKSVKKANGNALSSGNLKAGGIYQLRYDGSSFILLGEGGEYGTAIASDVLSGKTIGTDSGIVTGTMPNRGTFNIGFGAPVPAGYYSGGTVPPGTSFASGTITNGDTALQFIDTSGSNVSNFFIQVSGIKFLPKTILVMSKSTVSQPNFTLYTRYMDNKYRITMFYFNFNNMGAYGGFQEMGSASITSTGFTLPVRTSNDTFYWEAYA